MGLFLRQKRHLHTHLVWAKGPIHILHLTCMYCLFFSFKNIHGVSVCVETQQNHSRWGWDLALYPSHGCDSDCAPPCSALAEIKLKLAFYWQSWQSFANQWAQLLMQSLTHMPGSESHENKLFLLLSRNTKDFAVYQWILRVEIPR